MAHERRYEALVRASRQRHPHDIDIALVRHAPTADELRVQAERRLERRDFVASTMNDHERTARAAPQLRDAQWKQRVALRATADLEYARRRCHAGSPVVSANPSMRFAF